MLEIPEACTIAGQINPTLTGKQIVQVIASSSPHKFAWYYGDPADYAARLTGDEVLTARAWGGMVEVKTTRNTLLFSDGVNMLFHPPSLPLPEKHQLLLAFQDGSHLSASVQMYGGLCSWPDLDVYDNPYYLAAKSKPSPLDDETFTQAYFNQLLADEQVQKLSIKAALATQQRIPGLGNGVLQDILWNARLSPRKKVSSLTNEQIAHLFAGMKTTLKEMTLLGGRDTEKDLFNKPGGYRVLMSARSNGSPCPECGSPILKDSYLGGSVYYCQTCQVV